MSENKLTLEEAKRLSIRKWEMIIANGGGEQDEEGNSIFPPEIQALPYKCGFCAFAGRCNFDNYDKGEACVKCPIVIQKGKPCVDLGWLDYERKETIETAQVVLDLVKSIEVNE